MKKLLFITLLALATMPIASQSINLDSLVNVLETQKLTVQEQLQLYDKISLQYIYSDPEKCILYSNKGLRLAEKEKDKRMIARLSVTLGSVLLSQSPSDSALIILNRALAFSKETNDKESEAKAVGNLGLWYQNNNKKEEGLDYLLKSLALYESIEDKNNTVRLLLNIFGFYQEMQQNEHALQFLKRAQMYLETMDHPQLKMGLYSAFGGYYLVTQDFDSALENSLIALELSRQNKVALYEMVSLQLIAGIYSNGYNDYENAEKYALECVKVSESANNEIWIKNSMQILSKVYADAGKYKEGRDIALKLWEMDSVSTRIAINSALILSQCYLYLGDKEKAGYYMHLLDSMRIKQSEDLLLESISNMEIKYETEKKENRIITLEKERKLYEWLVISGGLLLVALVIVLTLTLRNARKQRQLVVAEALQEGELNERTRIAQDLHDRLGGSLSAVKIGLANEETLQIIGVKIDSCIKELREITNNIMPRSLQMFGMKSALDDFCVDVANLQFHFFGEAQRLRQNQEYTVYCCARELVNNALKHSGATTVNLQLVQSKKFVTLTVQDNGGGFDEKTVNRGNGLNNIRNRVASCKGRFDIISTPGKGTEAVIEIAV